MPLDVTNFTDSIEPLKLQNFFCWSKIMFIHNQALGGIDRNLSVVIQSIVFRVLIMQRLGEQNMTRIGQRNRQDKE